MQLSSHFSLEEMTHTDVRADNTCPPDLIADLTKSADMMERIRAALSAAKGHDISITINSAYRSAAVNAAVGSKPTSDHPKALAVDFKAPSFGTPYEVSKFLSTRLDALGVQQIIFEFSRWIHVSQRAPTNPVNRILTISSAGTQVGIQVVA